jgi:hypothetical protein
VKGALQGNPKVMPKQYLPAGRRRDLEGLLETLVGFL